MIRNLGVCVVCLAAAAFAQTPPKRVVEIAKDLNAPKLVVRGTNTVNIAWRRVAGPWRVEFAAATPCTNGGKAFQGPKDQPNPPGVCIVRATCRRAPCRMRTYKYNTIDPDTGQRIDPEIDIEEGGGAGRPAPPKPGTKK